MARVGRKGKRTTALAAAALLATGLLAACDSSGSSAAGPGTAGASSSPATSDSSSELPKLPPETLTFGVVGSAGEIAQLRAMADTFAPLNRDVTVKVESWPNDAAMIGAFREGTRVPDVFMASRRNLAYLTQHQLLQPVDGLLDDRGFDFGDEYPRTALTAFSGDNRLDCLPYDVQPTVMFYNKSLVRFGRIRNNPPTPGQGWSLDQFAAAARWAVQHHPGVAGAYVEPSLSGIAPFLYAGGGNLFDSTTQPTGLAMSEGTNQQTLIQTVRALRNAGLTLSRAQLERRTPLEWFLRGRLALLEGTRRMVPDLRARSGLDFDVMPMPSLGGAATVGRATALCVSAHPRDVDTAADFLVYASSPGALALVSYAGYLQPANQTVALSDAFQQPGLSPRHAAVFTFAVKSMVYPPVVTQWDDVDLAVDPLLDELLRGPTSDVPRLARKIDRVSYRLLGPRLGPSPLPSPTTSPTSPMTGTGSGAGASQSSG